VTTEAEDIERIRNAYAAFNDGDMKAFLETMSEDMEIRPVLGDTIGGGDVFHGHEGAVRWREMINSTLNGFKADVQEIIPAGDGVYVVLVHFSGTGTASGVEVTRDAANILTMRDGIAVRMDSFQDPDEALRAAGIER
jgi:ketosteroid isomerase-like protein